MSCQVNLPFSPPPAATYLMFDMTWRKWKIWCVNMTFDPLLSNIPSGWQSRQPTNPLKPAALRERVSIRPSQAGAVAGHHRWRGEEIEVSYVFQCDKQLNKMILMVVRRWAICSGPTLQRRLDVHELAKIQSGGFRSGKALPSSKHSVMTLLTKPGAVEEGQEKVGHPVAW